MIYWHNRLQTADGNHNQSALTIDMKPRLFSNTSDDFLKLIISTNILPFSVSKSHLDTRHLQSHSKAQTGSHRGTDWWTEMLINLLFQCLKKLHTAASINTDKQQSSDTCHICHWYLLFPLSEFFSKRFLLYLIRQRLTVRGSLSANKVTMKWQLGRFWMITWSPWRKFIICWFGSHSKCSYSDGLATNTWLI